MEVEIQNKVSLHAASATLESAVGLQFVIMRDAVDRRRGRDCPWNGNRCFRRRDGAGKCRIILASREVAACNGRRAQIVVVAEVLVAERDPENPLADKGAARK